MVVQKLTIRRGNRKPAYRPRRGNRKPTKALKRIASQVKSLTSQVNAEKKHFGPVIMADLDGASTIPFGLTNGTNADGGGSIIDLRPVIAEGTGRDERIGNSVKLHSMCLKIVVAGQSAQSMNSKMTFEIYKVNGNRPYEGTNRGFNILGKDLFKPDPLTLLFPPDATRNPNYFKQFSLVRRITKYTPQDNGGTSNFVSSFKIPLKFKNYHLRWDDVGNQLTQMVLVIRANNGNRSVATASLVGQAALGLNTAVNTGFVCNVIADYYYYDN